MSTQKQMYYHELAKDLAPFWGLDALMSEQDPERWQHARDLDDWLVKHRDHDFVNIKAYRVECIALRTIYETWEPKEHVA